MTVGWKFDESWMKVDFETAKQLVEKTDWKEEIQIYLGFNKKMLFFYTKNWKFFSHFVWKYWTLAGYTVNQILDQFIELHNTQFFQRPKNLTRDCILLSFFVHFEKLGVNLTPKSLYMEGSRNTQSAQISINQDKHKIYNNIYIYIYIYI